MNLLDSIFLELEAIDFLERNGLDQKETEALRTIREYGDDVLARPCKEIKEVTPRIRELVEDMLETMYDANGVGLAAPQVGILKRLVVIDVSPEADDPIIMINPVILETDGEQTGYEGCLSLPGKSADVERPEKIRIKALDRNGNEFELEADGLLAVCICHEYDHLEGILFTDRAKGEIETEED